MKFWQSFSKSAIKRQFFFGLFLFAVMIPLAILDSNTQAQLAALANTHLLIAKSERDGRTYTTVTPLDIEGRKKELARIIGGTNITETTLKSAEEMLRL